MDIEQKLRERLFLRDPGARFTDEVMSKLGDVPDGAQHDGVVTLAAERQRRRGRRLLLGSLVVAAAVAATLPFLHGSLDDEVVAGIEVAPPPAPESLAGAPPAADGTQELQASTNDLVDCLDPHVLFGLMLVYETDFKVLQASPPELGDLKPPRELTWLGAAERTTSGTSMWSAVYRTGLAPDAARAAMEKALVAIGWKARSSVLATYPAMFVSPDNPLTGEPYCREGSGLTLTASALDGVSYVVLSRMAGARFAATCDGSGLPEFTSATSPLDAALPQFVLPLDPATGRPVAMRGGGGGSSAGGSRWNRRSNISFRSRDSLGGIASHFASQLAAQGWRQDSSWSGTVSAGSTWSRGVDDGTLLEGSLRISAFGNDRYTVVFRASEAK